MNLSKEVARKMVFPALMKLNFDKAIRSFNDHGILNVMYHGVASESGQFFSPRHIAKHQFEEHLKYYRKNFNVISLTDAFYLLRQGIQPKKKTITISFDDGFQNNFTIALPLLEKYGMEATFFVPGICTEDMEVRCLWADLIATLQYFHPDATFELEHFRFRQFKDEMTGFHLYDFLKHCSYPQRDVFLDKLTRKYDLVRKINSLPAEVWKLVDKSELIALSQSKYAIVGSHGYLHYNLGNIEIEQARKELMKSKNVLQDAIQKEVSMIGYPDGSYNPNVLDAAEALGYTGQLAVSYQLPEDKKDLRILDRHGVSSTTTFESAMLNVNLAFRSKGH